jgi:hypothetical protein
LNYGIETSSDGVYAEPELPDHPPVRPLSKPAPVFVPQRRAGNDVFGAAALLIALVLVTTLLLAWAGPNHPLSFLKNEFALLSGNPTPPKPEPKPAQEKDHAHTAATQSAAPEKSGEQTPHAAPAKNPLTDVTPINPDTAPTTPTQPTVVPVAQPANPSDLTNAGMINPALPNAPVPALAAQPDSAFTARDIAEKSLPSADIAPTGKAELLKIIGERDDTQTTPTAWKYYFFDKSAAGHARIVTVNSGDVIKSGEDYVDLATPYSDSAILPEDKIVKDSTDALQIVQALIPGVPVTSSEFVLMQQKNSVPMWKVALWTKNSNGEEHKLGDVTLLAENGTIISRNLKP